MSNEHKVEILVNGWGLHQLQEAADSVYWHKGKHVRRIMLTHARRREYIHLLELERQLKGYHTVLDSVDVPLEAVRDFHPDRAALIYDDAEPALFFNFGCGGLETADGIPL